jgi:hypothetical protein
MNITEQLNYSEMDLVVFHDARDYELKTFYFQPFLQWKIIQRPLDK